MALLQWPSSRLVPPRVSFLPDEGNPTWRVRRHFDDVLRRLASRDTSHLADRLRRARSQNLDRLRKYADRGAFPKNDEFPGLLVPHFIDREGTTCAVAQLLIDSGHREIAERLAVSQNLLAVPAMCSADLDTWISESGFSASECAEVQPGYCCSRPGHDFEAQDEDEEDAGYGGDGGDNGDLGFDAGVLASSSGAQGAGGAGGGSGMGGTGGMSSQAAGGAAGSAGMGGAMGGGGAGGAAGAAGVGGNGGNGGSSGSAAMERRSGLSAVALVAARSGSWARGGSGQALATMSLGLLALIARRNKLRK